MSKISGKKIANGVTKGISKVKIDPSMLLQGLNEVVDSYQNYKITESIEKTKRAQIEAEKEIFIEKIHAQRDIMLSALDKTFEERRINFKAMFVNLDKAIESNNDVLANQLLGSIVELAKETPFKDIQRTISDFHDPGVKTIEI